MIVLTYNQLEMAAADILNRLRFLFDLHRKFNNGHSPTLVILPEAEYEILEAIARREVFVELLLRIVDIRVGSRFAVGHIDD